MREMSFLPQDYMIFQPSHHNNHNNHNHDDFNDDHHDHHHQDHSISLNILSSCPPQDFQGVPTLSMMNRSSMSFSGYHHDHHDQEDIIRIHDAGHDNHHDHDHHHHQDGGDGDQDELSDDGSQVLVVGPGTGEKKKRLNMEQVKTLEKNFEQANKLEPDKKVQLAKALGLQPRQVAIWFQNRRARWKTKQLDKDYSILKRQFDALKADNDSLLAQNKKLHAELISLRNRDTTEYNIGAINLNNTDTKSYWSNNGSEISSDINLGNSRTVTPQTGSPLNTFVPPTINQFLQNTTSSNNPELDLQCPKIDPPPPLHDDTFCNMFGGTGGGGGGSNGGIENQPPPFWAWPDQQHLN